jgi:hypothetical protein
VPEQNPQRASLALALVGTLLMLTVAVARMEPRFDRPLPRFDTSRPALPDWPKHPMEPSA